VTDLISGKGKLIVGLSGRDSLYRVISLPILEKSLLPEAVKREAARVLPVALDQLYLAYQRIPGGETETRIFLAAFPKNSTDILLKTLRMAGIAPQILDLAPLALCLSVNEPMSIIADASLDTLNIMVMADRVPQVIRSISLQSEGRKVS
jgi:type IV pilus assembly protein PilM